MITHDVADGGAMSEAARRLRSEMLVIVSGTDHVVTPGPALEFAELAGAETLVLDNDCGHLAPLCASAETGSAIYAFLRKP